MNQCINKLFHKVCRYAVMMLVAAPLGVAGVATASSLGPAADYNVFVLNDLTLRGVDSWGNVAVGGTADLSNFAVGSKLSGPDAQLVVGTTLSATSGSIGNGTNGYGTIYAPDSTGIEASVNNDFFYNNPGSVVDFSAAGTYLQNVSEGWSGLAATGNTNYIYYEKSGTRILELTGTESGLNVFDVDGSLIDGNSNFIINAPAGSTVLVNISGSVSAYSTGGYILNGVSNTNVLYNYYEASGLTFQNVCIQGSVLAPLATVNFSSGNINGQMIADNIYPIGSANTGEFHSFTFDGDLPPVPIPATVLLLGSGLVGLVGFRRRTGKE